MKRALLALAVVVMLAGCSAKANRDDFFGYMRKPLYASGFDLAHAASAPQTQEFFVEDGSIASVRIQVWINATAGSGDVSIYTPSGHLVWHATSTGEQSIPLELGAWKIVVAGSPDAAGHVDVLVTRQGGASPT